jgi:hypothetical protein
MRESLSTWEGETERAGNPMGSGHPRMRERLSDRAHRRNELGDRGTSLELIAVDRCFGID